MRHLFCRYIFLLSFAGGILCSCTTVPNLGELYNERITNARIQSIRSQKKLNLAVYGNNAREIEAIQIQLAASGISAYVLYADSKAALFPLLRSGRADIAAAMLTEPEITNKYLNALPFYTEKKQTYFLATRRNDPETASFFSGKQNKDLKEDVHKAQKHNPGK